MVKMPEDNGRNDSVDYNLPERFDLTYKGSDNELHRPVMIHRALWLNGTIYCILLEHTAGNFHLVNA
jgi:threonyl-tRNA synthetase